MRQFFITIFTPTARHLAKINPNALTIISLIAGILAGVSYVCSRMSPWFFLVGGGFIMISGTADSLDGIVARMFNRVTKKGDFLDHFCDRIVDISILIGLTFSRDAHLILGFSLTLLVLLHSYLGTQIEATLGKRSYKGTGKAEFFVGFIVFSLVAALFPELSLVVAKKKLVLADFFMSILLITTLISLIQRFFRGIKACIQSDQKK